jgi:hypothetical protein
MTMSPDLDDLEEAKTGLWVEQQLTRIHNFLVERGADDEMLDAVVYMFEIAAWCFGSTLLDELRAGKFPEGEA